MTFALDSKPLGRLSARTVLVIALALIPFTAAVIVGVTWLWPLRLDVGNFAVWSGRDEVAGQSGIFQMDRIWGMGQSVTLNLGADSYSAGWYKLDHGLWSDPEQWSDISRWAD